MDQETLKEFRLPASIVWTEDNGAAFVCDTRKGAKALRSLIEYLLGDDHPATLIVRRRYFGDSESGWTVAVEFAIGMAFEHRTFFPVTSVAYERIEALRFRALSIKCSADILSAANCAELDAIDAEITKIEKGEA